MPSRKLTKIKGTVGRYNDDPPGPTVILDGVEEWMTSKQARRFALRILKAADAADAEFEAWKAKRAKDTVIGQ